MYLRFFEEPNEDVLESALLSMDTLRIQGLLQGLSTAIVSSLVNAPDKVDEENSRNHLNGVITIADLLIEISDLIVTKRTIIPSFELVPMMEHVANALERLQGVKDERIAAIHAELGEHFGSATGFQKHNYREDAVRYRRWVAEQN